MPAIIQIEDLNKIYTVGGNPFLGRARDRIHAVQSLKLNIEAGEALGLAGESGSGKSTIGRCIVGLERPTSGDIYFRGRPITGLSQRELMSLRAEIQVVFQNPGGSLSPRFTVFRAVEEPLRRLTKHGPVERRRRVEQTLEDVGLPVGVFGKRLPRELSGGQQQRVGIARALSVRPMFLVLDEPVSLLDASVRVQVLNLLRDIRERYRLSYLYISHDFGTVRALCDRVAILHRGRLVELGTVGQVVDDPLHPYTRQLLSSVLSVNPDELDRHRVRKDGVSEAVRELSAREGPPREGEVAFERGGALVDAGAGHYVARGVAESRSGCSGPPLIGTRRAP